MNEVLVQIQKIGIVPVIKLDDPKDAEPLAKALIEGGLPCAEVTFRTKAAKESIQIMSEAYPEMLVGAGTVLTTNQVDEAVSAGAKFIVSPGLNPKVVSYCVEKGIPITPGCSNPSDIEQAIELGLDVVKFFPAEAAGGLAMIKAMSAPYVNMKFMPTGGINESNLNSYLSFSKIIACGGSWMVKGEYIEHKEFDKITELTKQAVNQMLGFKVQHIGINTACESEAACASESFNQMFGFAPNENNDSILVGSGIQIMKKQGLGTHGHIAITTNYMERALYHLERQGYKFNQATAKYGKKNQLKSIYLQQEFGGFAVELIEK